jgi:hypothetical protein
MKKRQKGILMAKKRAEQVTVIWKPDFKDRSARQWRIIPFNHDTEQPKMENALRERIKS